MNIQEQNPQSPTASSTTPLQRSSPKIAILHDAFLYRGGGERLVTLMAKSLDADLISGFFSEGSFDPRELGFEGRMMPLGKPVFAKGIRHTVLQYRFKQKTQFLSEYDIVIFSGNCLDAVKNLPATTKKIYYCHTPPRYIFDLRAQYLAKVPGFFHRLLNPILDYQARRYIEQLAGIDTIFTNSQNTHDRLLSYCHKESTILYPPTDTSRFVPDESVVSLSDMPSEYFLSCSRLSPPKRVDIVVRAFLDMPEYNLVFTYGANDPQREYILGLAK